MLRGKRFGRIARGVGRRRSKNEDGVILVFWAVSLTAMLGFVALTLDMGNDVQATTNIQNAADAAALAGASQLPNTGSAASEAQEVVESYISNIPATDWASCNPPTSSGFDAASTTLTCVAFNQSNTAIWVEIPSQSTASFFGFGAAGSFERDAYASIDSGQAGLCYTATTAAPAATTTTIPGECQ